MPPILQLLLWENGFLNPRDFFFLPSLKNKRVYLKQQAATSLIPPCLFMASPQELNFHSVHVFVSVLCSLKKKQGGKKNLTKGAGSHPCPHLSLWLKGNKVAAVGCSLIDQWLWDMCTCPYGQQHGYSRFGPQ